MEKDELLVKIIELEKENASLASEIEQMRKTSSKTFQNISLEILNNIDAIVYISDSKTYEVLFANEKFVNEFGEYKNKKCWQLIQENKTYVCEQCQKKELSNFINIENVDFERENISSVNNKWYKITTSLIHLEKNRLVTMQVMFDITDIKQKEKRLQYYNGKLNSIINAIPNIIWRAKSDREGNLFDMYISPIADKLLKLEAGTIDNNWYKYMQYVHPDDLQVVQNEITASARSLGNIDLKYRLVDSQANIIEVYSKGSVIEIDQNTLETYGVTIDLTDINKQQKIIKETERKYKILFELLPTPILLQQNNKIITENPAAKAFFEAKNANDFENKNIMDFILPEFAKKSADFVFDGKFEHKIHSFKSEKIQTFNNNIKDVDILVSTFSNMSGDEILLVSITDTTEINNAYRELEESKKQLKTVFDNANEAIFVVQNRCFKFFNKRTCELLNIDEEQLLNKEIGQFIHEDYRQIEMQRHLNRTKGIPVEESYYLKIVRADGKLIHAKVNNHFITWNNEKAVITVLDDITSFYETQEKLKNSEVRYKTLFENAPFPIVVHKNRKVVLYNNAIKKYLIPGNENYLLNKDIMNFVHPLSKEIVNTRVENVMAHGKTLAPADEKFLTPKGDIVDFEVSSVPIDYMGGRAILVILNDVTERKNTENKLKELIATKDKFFSIIAHDLKNPFHQILGFAELLLSDIDNYDKDEIHKIAQYLNTSAENGYKLLENLLEWSRSQTGRIKFDPQKIKVFDIVNEEIESLRANAIKKNISIENNITKNENCCGIADKDMLKTIIRNLLSNAIKFTFPGGKIEISLNELSGFYSINIKDNGIGIPPEIMDKIFRIDESVSTPGTDNEHGTGLGLALCKEFVEKNGGQISVESKPGKGSVFKFTIIRC